MAGIVTALNSAAIVISEVIKSKDAKEALNNTANLRSLVSTNGSITKLLTNTIIEPIIIVTKPVRQTDVYDKLLQLHLDIFSSFYAQAFRILQDIYGIDPNMSFDLLSTDKSVSLNKVYDKVGDAVKSLATKFTTSTKQLRLSKEEMVVGTYEELMSSSKFINLKLSTEDDKFKASSIKLDDNSINDTLVGVLQRTFNINLTVKDNHTIQIPITVKAHVILTDIHNVLNMLKPNSKDKQFTSRLDEYRASAITLKELIFCSDLIKEYKDNRIKDKESLLSTLSNRSFNSTKRMVNSNGVAGFERSYNMLIVSSDDKVYLDKHIGGDVTNEKYKQQLLEESSAMTLTIVDPDYERVRVLTKDIRGSSDTGFKTLNKRKDGSSDNMAEILKSLLMSRPLSF